MTNLEKFKQHFQTLTAQEIANLVYHPDTSIEFRPGRDDFCQSVDECFDMTCEECLVRWLESEVEQGEEYE